MYVSSVEAVLPNFTVYPFTSDADEAVQLNNTYPVFPDGSVVSLYPVAANPVGTSGGV